MLSVPNMSTRFSGCRPRDTKAFAILHTSPRSSRYVMSVPSQVIAHLLSIGVPMWLSRRYSVGFKYSGISGSLHCCQSFEYISGLALIVHLLDG